MNLVLDASVVIEFLFGRPSAEQIARRIQSARNLLAPHLLDAEVGQVVRKFLLRKMISTEQAAVVLEDFTDLPLVRYAHLPLLGRALELAHSLTVYDALYLGLAEATGAVLLTCDRALKSAPGHSARVELMQGE